jgi:hypothetical protein
MNAQDELQQCRSRFDPLKQLDMTYFAISYVDDQPAGFIACYYLPKLNAKQGYLYVDGL